MTLKEALEKRRDLDADQFHKREMTDVTQIIALNYGFISGADSMNPIIEKLVGALESIRLGNELEVPIDEDRFRHAHIDDLADIADEALADLHKELGME